MPGHRFFGGYIVTRREPGGGLGKLRLGLAWMRTGLAQKSGSAMRHRAPRLSQIGPLNHVFSSYFVMLSAYGKSHFRPSRSVPSGEVLGTPAPSAVIVWTTSAGMSRLPRSLQGWFVVEDAPG